MIRQRFRTLAERAVLSLWFGSNAGPLARACVALLSLPERLVGRVARKRAAGLMRTPPAQVPVIVVGNLVVGGTGKTPLVAAIASALAARGRRPGLIARGYRGAAGPTRVSCNTSAALAGDEALQLAGATGMPVYAARRRADALAALIADHPEIDVVIADDGLQHVGLPRSIEIAVFDRRGAGNGHVLPAGPLREPLSRLASVDAVVWNGQPRAGIEHPRSFASRISAVGFIPVADWPSREHLLEIDAFRARVGHRKIVALAGIASPDRFFATLSDLGIVAAGHALGDHARIAPADLSMPDAELIVMTEKDAVKCVAFADSRCWALLVRAEPEPALADWLEERIRGRPTR